LAPARAKKDVSGRFEKFPAVIALGAAASSEIDAPGGVPVLVMQSEDD
jgi:hypothetical protein